jgi:hypothetical protein
MPPPILTAIFRDTQGYTYRFFALPSAVPNEWIVFRVSEWWSRHKKMFSLHLLPEVKRLPHGAQAFENLLPRRGTGQEPPAVWMGLHTRLKDAGYTLRGVAKQMQGKP